MLDTIIVGQGLAGSLLGYELLKRGQSVKIIASKQKLCASRVAAGLIQTISGRYLSLADSTQPYINRSYQYFKMLEKELGQSFIRKVDCYRILDKEQVIKWEKRKQIAPYKPFMSQSRVTLPEWFDSEGFAIQVYQNFTVEPDLLLNCLDDYFKKRGVVLTETVDESLIHYDDNTIQYKELSAKRLVFCAGYYMAQSRYFQHVEFQNVKGETLTFERPEVEFDVVIQKKQWVVPFQSGRYRVGATYDHSLTEGITKSGQSTLSSFLDECGIKAYDVIDRQVGIRCVTKTRRPIVEQHPDIKNIYICAGFGSKGFMTCPFYMDKLLDWIL